MSKFTPEEKLRAVMLHMEKGLSCKKIAKLIGANKSSVEDWCRNYEVFGAQAFSHRIFSLSMSRTMACFFLSESFRQKNRIKSDFVNLHVSLFFSKARHPRILLQSMSRSSGSDSTFMVAKQDILRGNSSVSPANSEKPRLRSHKN